MAMCKKTKKTAKKAAKRTIKKKTSTKKGARGTGKAFGGYTINFTGCDDSLQHVFGSKPIAPSEMTKMLWAYVKKNQLNG